jgi:hypothetical protein
MSKKNSLEETDYEISNEKHKKQKLDLDEQNELEINETIFDISNSAKFGIIERINKDFKRFTGRIKQL